MRAIKIFIIDNINMEKYKYCVSSFVSSPVRIVTIIIVHWLQNNWRVCLDILVRLARRCP